jgi:hypothetical protein
MDGQDNAVGNVEIQSPVTTVETTTGASASAEQTTSNGIKSEVYESKFSDDKLKHYINLNLMNSKNLIETINISSDFSSN